MRRFPIIGVSMTYKISYTIDIASILPKMPDLIIFNDKQHHQLSNSISCSIISTAT